MQLNFPRNPFRQEDKKNGHETLIFENKEYEVLKRLGEERNPEGFFMRAELYRVKRKPKKGKTIKGYAVVTEMRSDKEDWHYWVEKVLKSKEAAEKLLDAKLIEIAEKFGVLDQLKVQISKKAKEY